MEHTKSGSMFTELILETFRFNGALEQAGDDLISDLGLTAARWQVMGVIRHEPATVSDIARQRGLSRQNVQRIVNRLVKDGFIEAADNPAHRRAKLCLLTSLGKETMEEVMRRQVVWVNELSKNIDVDALANAVSVMKECCHKVQTGMKEPDDGNDN